MPDESGYSAMASYVLLLKWTEQGSQNIRDTVKRGREFRADVERRGGKITGQYWTQGEYDIVVTVEFPDEQTAMAELLALCSHGNVRTQTLRAFTESEMETIIRKM
jgi:uncharacterized protein with GYD domain